MVDKNHRFGRRTVLKSLGASVGGITLGVGASGVGSAAPTSTPYDPNWVESDVGKEHESWDRDEPKPDMYMSTYQGVAEVGVSVHRVLSLVGVEHLDDPFRLNTSHSYLYAFNFASFGAGIWKQYQNLYQGEGGTITDPKTIPSLFEADHTMELEVQNTNQTDMLNEDNAKFAALDGLLTQHVDDVGTGSEWLSATSTEDIDYDQIDAVNDKFAQGAGLALGIGSTIASGGVATLLGGAGVTLSAANMIDEMSDEDLGIDTADNGQHWQMDFNGSGSIPAYLAGVYFTLEVPPGEGFTLEVNDDYSIDEPLYSQQSKYSEADEMLSSHDSDTFLVDIKPNWTENEDYISEPEVL
ncbi:hypothetical protein ACERIM_04035 [Natrinema sp. H-ect1]|uniref:hypothetical protein n=1 Tax=unclassified Natrinema TaxID=2622230 RepID=UPI00359EE488